ncbi:Zinc finger protein 862-like Protein [Tribolium castaneum]|uniref:Zinc finger protein 862-like Protein n=1 Tax=Tribolium castaneum TaxID=7070 RepID=D7EKB2_TRICA|nr:Zinc finger protein 862-like Protein [Tribolium castaneum]
MYEAEEQETEKITKKRKAYVQAFRECWKQKFKWVEEKNEKETRCRKLVEDPVEKQIKEAELKIEMFIVEHNLPFSLVDHLSELFNSICPDCKICKKLAFKRKKATQLCTSVIGSTCQRDLVNDLRNGHFSLILDETTDISTSKSLAVIARTVKKAKISDRFLDLIKVESATAKSLFEALKISVFEGHNIPFSNMIGFGADNCSVMMGDVNGLKALFQKENASIVTIGCTCHSFHLCASYACEKLPSTVEQFCRDIYNYFSNSSKRSMKLKECEIFCDEKPHRLLRPSQTRWLSLG